GLATRGGCPREHFGDCKDKTRQPSRGGSDGHDRATAVPVGGRNRPAFLGGPAAGRAQPPGGQPLPGSLLLFERLEEGVVVGSEGIGAEDRKSTRLNSSHVKSSYAV